MTHRLRETWVLVASASAIAIATAACRAPATDVSRAGTTHEPAFTNAIAGGGGSSSGSFIEVPNATGLELTQDSHVEEGRGRCPRAMIEMGGFALGGGTRGRPFCIDRYEASLVELLPNGDEREHSPFTPVARQQRVRAVSAPNVFPQGYISAIEAQRACAASDKRLCRVGEWVSACRGPEAKAFGYGARREPGRCNDTGRNPVLSLYGRGHWNWSTMNQPQLNQIERTLARTGEHEGCTNDYGVFDMVGNLHEWVADPGGTFYGGYYQDVTSSGHGQGCGYSTTAHGPSYHDYSTGFRCCADLSGEGEAAASPPRGRRPRAKR